MLKLDLPIDYLKLKHPEDLIEAVPTFISIETITKNVFVTNN